MEVDWDWIRADLAAGAASVRELARRHGISDTAIRKKIKKEGWEVKKPTNPTRLSKPAKPERERPHREAPPEPPPRPKPQLPALSVTISSAAAASHEEIARRTRRTLELLQAELDAEGVGIGFLEDAIDAYTKDDKSPMRFNAMMKAISLPTRILAAKNLSLALKTLKDTEPGKKQQAQDAADTAGEGTEWGDDLNVAGARAN